MAYAQWTRYVCDHLSLLAEKEMSMLQHFLLGNAILFILWMTVLKEHFYSEKNYNDIDEEVNKWLNQ